MDFAGIAASFDLKRLYAGKGTVNWLFKPLSGDRGIASAKIDA